MSKKSVFFNSINSKKILLNTFLYNFFFINFLFILKRIKKRILFIFNKKKNNYFLVFKNIKKKKFLKKKSRLGRLKELRMGISIHNRDYYFKIKKASKFLQEGYTVKIVIFFKGREIIFKEKGVELILKFQNNIKGINFKFSDIEFEGKQINSVFIPKIKNENKKKKHKFYKKKNNS
ncbi:translation initiation factor IF-3 [Candidatus Carsonella ruddii]|uniref:Translation initiation factor 3 C-terminal domain-containing protein n=1 Tax=Carsonella ruddii TaxID=114186 RepID=A0AAE7G459_CARRU|nr:translation initiation factor IF-3 [Candidatus Carsonella ruddii]AGS06601.1 translation initiation factor IF-3 [Candidatus Carsonella ruddii DC]QLK14078.1 hypothetical protein FK493_00615 [Candidatus Carsonella ruddii]